MQIPLILVFSWYYTYPWILDVNNRFLEILKVVRHIFIPWCAEDNSHNAIPRRDFHKSWNVKIHVCHFTKGSQRIHEISRRDHHFFDDDGNAEMLIMTTKEAFELKYKRGKTMFAQEAVLRQLFVSDKNLICRIASICHWDRNVKVYLRICGVYLHVCVQIQRVENLLLEQIVCSSSKLFFLNFHHIYEREYNDYQQIIIMHKE